MLLINMANELDRALVDRQLKNTLNNIHAPDFFEELSQEELYGIVPSLISNALKTLKQIPQFKDEIFEEYFNPSGVTKPFFRVDVDEYNWYDISYFNGGRYMRNNRDENLFLIRSGIEKVNLNTYHLRDKSVRVHVSYSDDAPNFLANTFADDIQAIDKARKLINGLKSAAI